MATEKSEGAGVGEEGRRRTGRDPDRLPDSEDPSGPCPRCGRPSNFTVVGQSNVTWDDQLFMGSHNVQNRLPLERLSVLMCDYCMQGVVVIEKRSAAMVEWVGIHWWPTPGGGSFGSEVSVPVAAAFGEGVRCLSAAAPNGAVAMFRTALTNMVAEFGSPAALAKGDLKDKIAQMVRDGGPLGALGDWATHVRLYGNAGAHPDLFGDVTPEEAEEVAHLVKTMIELLYTLPATIKKRQAERRP
jgi:hypothetical protein